jgi:hypothetical protein
VQTVLPALKNRFDSVRLVFLIRMKTAVETLGSYQQIPPDQMAALRKTFVSLTEATDEKVFSARASELQTTMVATIDKNGLRSKAGDLFFWLAPSAMRQQLVDRFTAYRSIVPTAWKQVGKNHRLVTKLTPDVNSQEYAALRELNTTLSRLAETVRTTSSLATLRKAYAARETVLLLAHYAVSPLRRRSHSAT